MCAQPPDMNRFLLIRLWQCRHGLVTLAVACLLGGVWASCSVVNQPPSNQPPEVQIREADTTVVSRGGRVEFTVSASDEDDDPLRYEWSAQGVGSFTDSLANSTAWIAPAQIFGNSEFFLITVTILDSQPDTEDPVETFLIEVVQRPPVLRAPADTVVSFREPVVLLQAFATDADNDAVTIEWEVIDGGLPADRVRLQQQTRDSVSTVLLLALEPGDVSLAVIASDGSDTLRSELVVTVTAPTLPETGTAVLEMPSLDGGTRSYEIDVYEYPNQRGVEPLFVDSWFEADVLCRARNMRLCSAEEWINACQGPEARSVSSVDERDALPAEFGRRFCNEQGSDLWGGDTQNLEAVAPSGSFPNCTSGSGTYDMTGNAFEWVQEWVPPEQGATSTDGVGRRANFAPSSTIFSGVSCGGFGPGLGLLQLEGDLPRPVPQAFIDSLFSAPIDPAFVDSARTTPTYAPYFDPGLRRGFRCCR